jgi:hypothetical protein
MQIGVTSWGNQAWDGIQRRLLWNTHGVTWDEVQTKLREWSDKVGSDGDSTLIPPDPHRTNLLEYWRYSVLMKRGINLEGVKSG